MVFSLGVSLSGNMYNKYSQVHSLIVLCETKLDDGEAKILSLNHQCRSLDLGRLWAECFRVAPSLKIWIHLPVVPKMLGYHSYDTVANIW